MITKVISYSLTGNNEALAKSIAAAFGAQHLKIVEPKPRTRATILFDLLFNRTPKVSPVIDNTDSNGMLVLVGPVWMGHVATPLRAYLKQLKNEVIPYAFISISGGGDGNPKLADELTRRAGREPEALIDLHITDLVSPVLKASREEISRYRLNDNDIKKLTDVVVKALHKALLKKPII